MEQDNKMTSGNLGIVFGPTLMRPRPTDATISLSSLVDYPHQARIIEALIIFYSTIFEDKEPAALADPSKCSHLVGDSGDLGGHGAQWMGIFSPSCPHRCSSSSQADTGSQSVSPPGSICCLEKGNLGYGADSFPGTWHPAGPPQQAQVPQGAEVSLVAITCPIPSWRAHGAPGGATVLGGSVTGSLCPAEPGDRSGDSDSELEDSGDLPGAADGASRTALTKQESETSTEEAQSCEDGSEGQRSRSCSVGRWDVGGTAAPGCGPHSDTEEFPDHNTNQSNNAALRAAAWCPAAGCHDGRERQPRLI